MGAGDAAPDGAELGSPDLFLRLVDKAHTLAKVVGRVLLGNHLVDLEERGVLMLVAKQRGVNVDNLSKVNFINVA